MVKSETSCVNEIGKELRVSCSELRDGWPVQLETRNQKLETRTDQASDDALGEAAKSFGRYLSAIGVRERPDLTLLNDHIDCLHTLALEAELAAEQKLSLIAALKSAVQGKIAAPEVSPG